MRLILTVKNRSARPVGYAVVNKSPATWPSKNMGLSGSILLLFIVIHMGDFWFSINTAIRYLLKNTALTCHQKTTDTTFLPQHRPILKIR